MPNHTKQTLHSKALNALARREHSRLELARKLSQSGADAAEVEIILDEFSANGWQSDRRFAESYCRSRAARYYGPRKIAYELAERGISPDLSKEILTGCAIDWQALAEETRQRKFGTGQPNTWAEKAKQKQYLYQRGF
jgi:regulatory protein